MPEPRISPRQALDAHSCGRLRSPAGPDPARPAQRARTPRRTVAGKAPCRASGGCPYCNPPRSRPMKRVRRCWPCALDVLVVAAYGLILPPAVLCLAALRLPQHPRVGACRAGAEQRPSSAPSRRETPRPASRSCKWMQDWIPVRWSSSSQYRSIRGNRGNAARQAGRCRRRRCRGRLAGAGARRVTEGDATAHGGRHLCRQGRSGRCSHRLVRLRRRDRPADPRLRSGARAATHFGALGVKVWRAATHAGASGARGWAWY